MPRTIPQYLAETATRLPDKIAIRTTKESITFGQLHKQALASAECYREFGIKSGDRIGVCMEKSIDQVIVILGILFANTVVVPVLPRLKRDNIQHIITNSGMTALVTDSGRIDEVKAFSNQTKLIVGGGEIDEDWPNLAYIRQHLQPRMFFDRIGADNAAIIYSSGSSGRPKGILIAHRNLADGADIVSQYLDTTEDDRIGCVLSFNFDYGLNQIWQTIRKGCTLHLHDFALPHDLFALLQDQQITALPVMPVIISQMFDRRLKVDVSQYDFSNLRYICSTGGRLSDVMLSDLDRTFPKTDIYSMFGLTEAFRGTYLSPERLKTHPTSIGKSIPGCEVMVLDEDGEECAPGVVGELVQRGATVSKGYWNDPENTARVFRTHPRFPGETLVFSGDNAMRDEDGYLYFVARRDEMIKTKGFRVSPTEVESEIMKNDKVCDAVAFAIPNVAIGEDIACAYTTDSGEPMSEKLLRQYLRRNLASHMVPTHLIHFDSFPITGNAGKLDRSTIKKTALEKLGVQSAADQASNAQSK